MVLKVIVDDNKALPYYTYIDINAIIAIDAIDSPQFIEEYTKGYHKYKIFKVYFNNYTLNIDISCYDRVLKSWLLVKNKDRRDLPLCNTNEDSK